MRSMHNFRGVDMLVAHAPDPDPETPEGINVSPEVNGLDVTLPQPSGPGSDRPIEVNWGDGSPVEYIHGNPANSPAFPATHTYSEAGTYTVTLDPEGEEYPVTTVQVELTTPVAPATETEVPKGTSAEILAWVGDDADRAQRALDAERASDSPRVTLIAELEKRVG